MAIPDPIEGVAIAWDDDWNEESPTWSRLDTNPGYRVQGYTVDRGRDYEMDTTDTGRATIRLLDKAGDFDPTNILSPLYGKLDPGKPAGIGLHNPVSGLWHTIFRGFVASITATLHKTKGWLEVEIELVDGLNMAARMELVPEAPFDAGGSEIDQGNIVYAEDLTTDAVQTRILAALDQMGWPAALRQVFTGNVKLWETVYAPRTAILNVIRDAADAEFPGVANVYVNRNGDFTFHGRLARFNPQTTADNNHETSSTEWEFESWVAGDDEACSLDPENTVRIVPPLMWERDEENLYTAAIATDKNIDDGDIAGQYVDDPTAIGKRGTRTWSAEGLLTAGGEGTTALEETAKFSAYYKDNYASALTRVPVITVVSQNPAGTHGPAAWKFLSRVDISDVVTLRTFHAWGLGFDDDFYVEGVHYDARKGPGRFLIVECRVDLSPSGYYDFNPWEGS